MPRKAVRKHELYDIESSPFSQKPTQREIAALIGETRDDLRRLVNYKEQFIVRRQIASGRTGKIRDLAYPVGRLRAAHERLKFHLNKVRQPSYLFSPRKGKGQRDNAVVHLDQMQYLTLDIKQFYPSTSEEMVWDWFRYGVGMYEDVAGLLTHLCTIDRKVSFGSPLTPVLCALIHRQMFDEIADICEVRGLRYSLWVDDLTISGEFVAGEVLNLVRSIIRAAGLKAHKVRYRSGNRPVFITGIGVVGPKIVAPSSLELKIRDCWADYHGAETPEERESATQRLLSLLGTVRQVAGARSARGMRVADEMNSLRQKRVGALKEVEAAVRKRHDAVPKPADIDLMDLPF